jgi:hypothetical protein
MGVSESLAPVVAWTFSPWVAVIHDIDRYADRISKSEAIYCIEKKIVSLLLIRLRRRSRVREHTGY